MALHNARGNYRVKRNDSTGKGVYAADGALRVTVVDGTTRVGQYAADGSLNVIIVLVGAAAAPLLHASGATRVVEATTQKGIYAANGSFYIEEIV